MTKSASNSAVPRILSLDQFRGYTVLGMFFVNYMGHFKLLPEIWKHHENYCSYADTIMPQFFFAAGFSYRLTFLRRLATSTALDAYRHAITRSLGLILLGLVIYHPGGKYDSWSALNDLTFVEFLNQGFRSRPFQTLVHIAVTSLWILPVVASSITVRVTFLILSGCAHLGLSACFYYDFVYGNPRGIDGGPLGFMTWTIPMLVGTFAYDFLAYQHRGWAIRRCVAYGLVLSLIGYGLASVPHAQSALNGVNPRFEDYVATLPFCKPVDPAMSIWTMSQRAGSVSYLTFASGVSLLVYAVFIYVNDNRGWTLPLFRTLGGNALAAYILADMVEESIRPYTPKDSPVWYALTSFVLFLGITYLFLRYLEKKNLYLRL